MTTRIKVYHDTLQDTPDEMMVFFHCRRCLEECPDDQSPAEWARLSVGTTTTGDVQVRCTRHNINIDLLRYRPADWGSWVDWGGEREAGPENVRMVEVRLRCDEIVYGAVTTLRWSHSGGGTDVVAYRAVSRGDPPLPWTDAPDPVSDAPPPEESAGGAAPDGEWQWNLGGGNPAGDDLVEVQFRGISGRVDAANNFVWTVVGSAADVVRWRRMKWVGSSS